MFSSHPTAYIILDTSIFIVCEGTRNKVLRSVFWLLVTANVSNSPILLALMVEAIRSFETSVLTRATRRQIPGTAFFPVTAVKTSFLHSINWLGSVAEM
jgi:hypothetical protein